MLWRVDKVADSEVEAAFDVLQHSFAWLEKRQIKQRISSTSIDVYRQWQSEEANYLIRAAPAPNTVKVSHAVDEKVHGNAPIAGVFSLPIQSSEEWAEMKLPQPSLWLRALATHPDFRNLKVGQFAVQSAKTLAGEQVLYLDCVSGFLPAYYQSLGFELISSKASGEFEINLLQHQP